MFDFIQHLSKHLYRRLYLNLDTLHYSAASKTLRDIRWIQKFPNNYYTVTVGKVIITVQD